MRATRVAFFVAAGLGLAVAWQRSTPPSLPPLVDPAANATYAPFWVDTAEGRLSLDDLRGKAVIVYFGYTSCPDFCPTTLATLGAAVGGMAPADQARVTALMVSLDPERDDLAKLSTYAAYFHPSFRAGTRAVADLTPLTADWGVVWRKVPLPDSAIGWAVDHTTDAFLVGPDGVFRERIPHGTPAGAVRDRWLSVLQIQHP